MDGVDGNRGLSEVAGRLGADLDVLISHIEDSAGQEVFWDCFGALTELLLDNPALCWAVVRAAREQPGSETDPLLSPRLVAQEDAPDGWESFNAVSRALCGVWVDTDELGYDLAKSHIAVIADTSSTLETLADHTGREMLQVATPTDGVWAWLGGHSRLSDEELDELVAWQCSREGSIAFGEPADGITGFSVSHTQALEARSVAGAISENAIRFGDVRLLTALVKDRQLAHYFIERELRELDQAGERMTELRATVRVYLEHGQNVSAAAAVRRRDRKTIQRQLRAAERLIHHDVRERSSEVLVALRASEILRNR